MCQQPKVKAALPVVADTAAFRDLCITLPFYGKQRSLLALHAAINPGLYLLLSEVHPPLTKSASFLPLGREPL